MPFKVDREDFIDSMWTKFTVFIDNKNTQGQEFNVPVWDADDFENKVKGFTSIDFNTFMNKAGKKNARSSS